MAKMVGIDLGTTNSVVAIVDGPQARVLENRDNQPQTRSVVGLRKRKGKEQDPELLLGDVALDNWRMAPRDTIISIKRLMGRAVADPDVQKVRKSCEYEIVEPSDGTKESVRVVMGGKEYSPIDISAMILQKLKDDAEYRLQEGITHAVITVPAYFSQKQKRATREAGLKAGLKVIRVLDEPTAAAVAFGVEGGVSAEPKAIVVYDLGGGTFDISILLWAGNTFAPLNLDGDMWLGGDNFDQVLVDHVVAYVKEEFDVDPATNWQFMVDLRKAAKATKERLSSARSADLIVSSSLKDKEGEPVDVVMEITREEYERMIEPLVTKAIKIVEKALKKADLTPAQIDYVLMAGNATCIPLVQQSMEKMFGEAKISRKVHPKQCVALGAAIVAARIGERIVCQSPDPADPKRECGHVNKTEATICEKCSAALALESKEDRTADKVLQIGSVAPYPYGVQIAGDKFSIFVQKNDPVPTQEIKTQTLHTQAPNQRMVAIPVYGGENAEKASANERQGEAFCILPSGLPKGTPIRIKIWLDSDGVFDLSAVLEDGTDMHPWVVQGDKDKKAVEAVEKVEVALAEKADSMKPDQYVVLDAARQAAFEELRKKNYEGAVEHARHAEEMVDKIRAEEVGGIRLKADRLIGYAEFVVHEFGWALAPDKVYQLNRAVEEVRQAIGSGDAQAINDKVTALDQETDKVPDVVKVLIGIRGAIGRIRLADPVKAQSLAEELGEIEEGLKRGDKTAFDKLDKVCGEVTGAIEAAEDVLTSSGSQKCPVCGEETKGKRVCANGHDQWLLEQKDGRSSGNISSSGTIRT